MALFLMKNEDGTYREILQVSCILEVSNAQKSYRFEKPLFPSDLFPALDIKNSYELTTVDDIAVIEEICKREVLTLVKEQRERKVANHKAQIANIVLWINNDQVFDLKKDFDKLWKATNEQLENRVEEIRVETMKKAVVYGSGLKSGYLI